MAQAGQWPTCTGRRFHLRAGQGICGSTLSGGKQHTPRTTAAHTSGEIASRREAHVERERCLIFVQLEATLTRRTVPDYEQVGRAWQWALCERGTVLRVERPDVRYKVVADRPQYDNLQIHRQTADDDILRGKPNAPIVPLDRRSDRLGHDARRLDFAEHSDRVHKRPPWSRTLVTLPILRRRHTR